jgi:hypothetical protein
MLFNGSAALANPSSALPPCRLDSFVAQAGSRAESIYGDEGVHTPPPFFGFTKDHRIATGITGQRDAGLTTGHGSYMPSATGRDEFISAPGEWCYSGPNGGRNAYSAIEDQGFDASFGNHIFEKKIADLYVILGDLDSNIKSLREFQKTLPADAARSIDQQILRIYNQRNQIVVTITNLREDMRSSFAQPVADEKE